MSSLFHSAQRWANGSLWATLSSSIPSFSLQINVLPRLVVAVGASEPAFQGTVLENVTVVRST